MDNIQVTSPGVFKLLSNLDIKKSSGPDDISPPGVLKECASELAPVLTYTYSISLSSLAQSLPIRVMLMFSLFTKKGPRDVPENYRPISLTSPL
jgi:hypothetical protein